MFHIFLIGISGLAAILHRKDPPPPLPPKHTHACTNPANQIKEQNCTQRNEKKKKKANM